LSKSLQNRLDDIERRKGPKTVTLFYRNGSSRSVSVRNPLDFFVLVCRFWSQLYSEGLVPGVLIHPKNPDAPPRKELSEREVQLVKLFGFAERADTGGDRFLFVIWGLCRNGGSFKGPLLPEVLAERERRRKEQGDKPMP
jgi:hypothetical protein